MTPKLKDLHVRLVSRCNLNCKHCYASDWFSRSDQLDTALVKQAIDQALELGCEKATFTGGEPALHREIGTLLQHCIDRNLRVKLETNGLLLRQDGGALIELIKKHKDLIYLYLSYDLAAQRGMDEAQHELVRALAIELHEARVDIRLQTTLTTINIGRLEDLLDLPRRYGIHQRIFLGHSTSGNGAALTPFDLDFVLTTFEYLRSLGLNHALELPPLISGQLQRGCGWGLHRCEIMSNGDVTTCGPITFTHTEFVAGNLMQQSLYEIWNDSSYYKKMRAITQDDFKGVCGRCRHWSECRGSCRSVSWTRGEDWFSPYPLCQLFAERYPERVRGQLTPGPIAFAAGGASNSNLVRLGRSPRVD